MSADKHWIGVLIMDKFVKAEDVKDLLNGLDSLPWEDEVEEMVDKLVTADVVEVKHGKWEYKHHPLINYACSECGQLDNPYKYCPNCGAKMDLE